MKKKKKTSLLKIVFGIFALIVIIAVLKGGSQDSVENSVITNAITNFGGGPGSSFDSSNNEICTIEGKPIIRLFSTTWCPHCSWIGETYERVAKEYVDAGKIVAYHWELDIKDNSLTSKIEAELPPEEIAIYTKFSPKGNVPTFVFGCKYSRIGNAFEKEADSGLIKEEAEFRSVIESLI